MESQQASLSPVSYKSTHSSRSSVLERAREYNRRIEDQKHGGLLGIQHSSGHYNNSHGNSNYDRRRSKSLERGSLEPYGTNAAGSVVSGGNSTNYAGGGGGSSAISSQQSQSQSQYHPHQQRSHSAGRAPQYYNYNMDRTETEGFGTTNDSPTRHRAMASVNKKLQPPSATSSSYNNNNNTRYKALGTTQPQPSAVSATTKTPVKSNHTYNRDSTQQQQRYNNNANNSSSHTLTPTTATTATQSSGQHQQQHGNNSRTEHNQSRMLIDEKKEEFQTLAAPDQSHRPEHPPAVPNGPVVTPELLVDALSGHEDGLLAIAEKLMEHYDSGYDVMGEAIIDAFADVQKLFQHGTKMNHVLCIGSVSWSLSLILCFTFVYISTPSGRSGAYGRCSV